MVELILLFKNIDKFYDLTLIREQIEELYENVESNRHTNDGTSNSDEINAITSLPIVRRAVEDDQLLNAMQELSATIRMIRGEGHCYDNTHDCWDQVIKVSPREAFLNLVYTLAGLALLEPKNDVYSKLSLVAVSTYFLTLTIPGAKGFHIFDEDVISHCLRIFSLVEYLQDQKTGQRASQKQSTDIWIRLLTLCDDLKLVLRYVHLSEYKITRDLILKKFCDVQYINFERGYANKYAAELHEKCFGIFEEMINAHNGEPEETLTKLLTLNLEMHTYSAKPKYANNLKINEGDNIGHISNWFIKCIGKSPLLVANTLKFFIECIVTNPIKSWKTEQIQRVLDYCARYDAALYTKCNESCVELLCEAVYSDEVMTRARAIDLMSRILQLESQVDWQMFRHEIAAVPREVELIKELIKSLKDHNHQIKSKALQALNAALTRGSPNARKILTEGIKFANYNDNLPNPLPTDAVGSQRELLYVKPAAIQPQYSFEGSEILEELFLDLPKIIYKLILPNPNCNVRRAGILFLEQMVKLNPLVIFNTNFVFEITAMTEETNALVRKQTMATLDAILVVYPNCYPVIWAWCKVFGALLKDHDAKNVEFAMECFRNRVLANIRGFDKTNTAENYMPWVILRTMVNQKQRLYWQNCFHSSLQARMVDAKLLSCIESHLTTSNDVEAWVLLNFLSGKAKSKDPDVLVHAFLSTEKQIPSVLIALEVMSTCINDFSSAALNQAFDLIIKSIRDGMLLPMVVGKAFNFLMDIDNRSKTQNTKTTKQHSKDSINTPKDWISDLHIFLEERILNEIADFPNNHLTFMSLLFSYSEVNQETSMHPDPKIVTFVHNYMRMCSKFREEELTTDRQCIFNSMIIISGRFSLRDASIASDTCNLYGDILRSIDNPQIVNTIIIAVSDLCKKHTQIVEPILMRMLRKLSTPYELMRIEIFKCFSTLILQDQIKFKGSVLLALLATILDESKTLRELALHFFSQYLKKKNSKLFQKCLVECPWVFNGIKNSETLESFSGNTLKSPLEGISNRDSRQILYRYFMSEIDEVNLLLNFKNVKVISEKLEHDSDLRSPEGLALIQDTFYILARICEICKEQKVSQETENSELNDMNVEEIENEQPAAEKGANDPKISARARKKRDEMMEDAMTAVTNCFDYIVKIHSNVNAHNDEVQESFDDLCKALAIRFPDMVNIAQPTVFWEKYRTNSNKPTNKKKASQVADSNDNAESNNPTDILLSSTFPSKAKRARHNPDERLLPIESLLKDYNQMNTTI